MEIKEYILNDEDLEKIKNRTTAKKRNVPTDYHVLFQSGCDFGIEKKRGKKLSRLIVLVSKGQYYITEGESVKLLNVRLLKNFLKGKRQIGGAYQKLLLFTMINSNHSKEELFLWMQKSRKSG